MAGQIEQGERPFKIKSNEPWISSMAIDDAAPLIDFREASDRIQRRVHDADDLFTRLATFLRRVMIETRSFGWSGVAQRVPIGGMPAASEIDTPKPGASGETLGRRLEGSQVR